MGLKLARQTVQMFAAPDITSVTLQLLAEGGTDKPVQGIRTGYGGPIQATEQGHSVRFGTTYEVFKEGLQQFFAELSPPSAITVIFSEKSQAVPLRLSEYISGGSAISTRDRQLNLPTVGIVGKAEVTAFFYGILNERVLRALQRHDTGRRRFQVFQKFPGDSFSEYFKMGTRALRSC
jgi:hypothetical protein